MDAREMYIPDDVEWEKIYDTGPPKPNENDSQDAQELDIPT